MTKRLKTATATIGIDDYPGKQAEDGQGRGSNCRSQLRSCSDDDIGSKCALRIATECLRLWGEWVIQIRQREVISFSILDECFRRIGYEFSELENFSGHREGV